jgi:Peroxidase, family 2
MTTSLNGAHSTTSTAWRRPAPDESRSPCPALNSLANGGHIPRDGRRITADQLTRAMEKHLGLDPRIGAGLAKVAVARLGTAGPDGVKSLDLARLSLHGFIEHDASLTRRDAHTGDAAEVVEPLFKQLVALSADGRTITRDDLAVAHQLRMVQSASAGRKVSLKAGVLGTMEAALLFEVLSRDGAIAIPDLIDFLQDERIPEHFTPRPVNRLGLFRTAALIALKGNVPLFDTAKRARKAAAEIAEPQAPRGAAARPRRRRGRHRETPRRSAPGSRRPGPG